MSVALYDRTDSNVEFINTAYEINLDIGLLVIKLPIKYQKTYGDYIIKQGLDILKWLQTGNGIYLSKNTSQEMFDYRKKCFLTARGFLYNLPSVLYLCNKIRIRAEHPDNITKDKWYSRIYDLIDKVNKCISLITGLIKSDEERYNKYKSNT